MTEPIKFYSTADEYGEFSNFCDLPSQDCKENVANQRALFSGHDGLKIRRNEKRYAKQILQCSPRGWGEIENERYDAIGNRPR